ncbi:uncharacterized protein BYT42DRAFT_565019 [Radiomyces spectabilis]|uniref:uncharacterized protein n=1 Tax=Radiomyces spectabilis TaxID=64574 RepID=UPI00221F8242|nr:uncharacterized protein BYT42DRAFT_565019 [Radiomyces spectabilis]KAI8381031.1 hypothetical protein BYT42DRAFT_565019 [Radiomyces spectabilis]
MFKPAPKKLQKSLHAVFENAEDYLADVCFDFQDRQRWAHKGILLARIPQSFRDKYLPQLVNELGTIHLDISSIISYPLFVSLLRFWYTADLDNVSVTSPPIPIHSTRNDASSGHDELALATLSLESTAAAETVTSTTNVLNDILALEEKLQVSLLPKTENQTQQLMDDLERMRTDRLGTDVILKIFEAPGKHSSNQRRSSTPASERSVSFHAHRFILASQSSYFQSIFNTHFHDPSCSTVHLPSDLFSSAALEIILHYFYTDVLLLPPLTDSAKPFSLKHQPQLTHKKHYLRILQKTFRAAEYLGHVDTICSEVLHEMAILCHQFKCVCSDCVTLLPFMLSFADKYAFASHPSLRAVLLGLYADPIQTFTALWSQKPFAILVQSMTGKPGSRSISCLQSPSVTVSTSNESSSEISVSTEPATLIDQLMIQTRANITKHNAIHVLHSIHLCISKIRSIDPLRTWSAASLDLIQVLLHHAIALVSLHFDYYCVEYPILLSCVDGIGFGFSVDFLAFLLKYILDEGINDRNAGILYQGIVRDLGGRQEVVKNVAVDGVLIEARARCAAYLSERWMGVKEQGGFETLDKDVLRSMSEDINVPYRTLAKSSDYEFSILSSLKLKPSKAQGKSKLSEDLARPNKDATNLGTTSSSFSFQRPRGKTQNKSDSVLATISNSSSKTEHRRSLDIPLSSNELDRETNEEKSNVTNEIDEKHQSSHAERTKLPIRNATQSQPLISHRSSSSLTDALLPLDPLTGPDDAPRVSRLRFELPTTPLRAKSPGLSKHKRARSPRRSRWSFAGYTSDSTSDDEQTTVLPVIGTKVELLRRPLPTLGTIKYIGSVEFAKGTWVGIELESRRKSILNFLSYTFSSY